MISYKGRKITQKAYKVLGVRVSGEWLGCLPGTGTFFFLNLILKERAIRGEAERGKERERERGREGESQVFIYYFQWKQSLKYSQLNIFLLAGQEPYIYRSSINITLNWILRLNILLLSFYTWFFQQTFIALYSQVPYPGAPGWLSRLSVLLLISVQVVISQFVSRALHWVWACLGFSLSLFSLPLPFPRTCTHSLK